ncbi:MULTISPECIES: hypothetical protein [Tatumella]|uniref:Uncharacterized protein n=1 Tax=Tatumella punctata TaxID=399969 RepID=A0ABW1VP38_9GAMM|nr:MULTISPECIES: hypothetical protein [unclassified Tatumella]MBS0856828.1 hypothetical protein [Tatumella sp. JGM16]MBS0878783.1 hypothetical protein [Tatumella sp. JGM82]MBS0890112.1 hypothetical protein [Tatumella sp. JGM94]MBS0893692.1 hypothetical protein [Tatumella sp. JGM130]MBS0901947.1 hypothetical protein [Tatumella sp. JGM100]
MKTKKSRPRKPSGRWVYYLLYQEILWPCPVRWEWESGFGGWLPFYYAPTFEFIAADPARVTRVRRPVKGTALSPLAGRERLIRQVKEDTENEE